MEIDIKDFLTDEHKKMIQEKISQAINKIDVARLAKGIEEEFKEYDWGMAIYDEIEIGDMAKIVQEKIIKALK